MALARKITWAKRARLFCVARLRLSDPGDTALAAELGLSVRAVQYHLRQLKLRIHVNRERRPLVIPRAWLFQSAPDDATGEPEPESADPGTLAPQGAPAADD